ncbi:unnamed protein product, partial [Scytosiphon promiscuus]
TPTARVRLVSQLRAEADRKVQEREDFLAGLRDLLFPPESTSSPESPTILSSLDTKACFPGSLPSVVSPRAACPSVFHVPSLQEVHAAVRNLRETSLCVVEVIQSWRRARQEQADGTQPGGDFEETSSAAISWDGNSGDCSASNNDNSFPGPEHDVPESRETKRDKPDEIRFPLVPTARPVGSVDEGLPTYYWRPPAVVANDGTRRNSLNPDTWAPERVGRDLTGGSAEPGASDATGGRRQSERAVRHAAPETPGVNYLARMATDTDFVGASGSVLADLFPPDTKLYRNPFILGRNLDDTLAVFARGGSASPRHDSRDGRDGAEPGPSLSQARRTSRLDTRRFSTAAAAIVAEDARERVRRRTKRPRCEMDGALESGGDDGDGGASPGSASFKGRAVSSNDRETFDGLGSGGPRSCDGDRDGSGQSSTKTTGKGGITFQDQRSEDGQTDGHPGSDGGQGMDSSHTARKKGHHHPGKMKRGRKAKTVSHMNVDASPGDLRVPDTQTRPGTISTTKYGSRGGGDWTAMPKATKEPLYKGPWVPVLLDTNVSCPEGINEILAEDDVSWQLRAGDRIRVGCCTGHEWEVTAVVVVPGGKGKCRVALSEMYNHAKSMRPQQHHDNHDQGVHALSQQQQRSNGNGWSSSHPTGPSLFDSHGQVGGRGAAGARLVRAGTQAEALKRERGGLRTVSSNGNVKAVPAEAAAVAGAITPRTSPRSTASSSSAPLLLNPTSTPESASPARHDSHKQKSALQPPEDVGSANEEAKYDSTSIANRELQASPQTTTIEPPPAAFAMACADANSTAPPERNHTSSPTAVSRVASGATKARPTKSASGKKKQPGSLRRGGAGSAASSTAMGVSSKRLGASSTGGSQERSGTASLHAGAKHHGGGGGSGRGKGATGGGGEESPEKHAARNREIFEQNLKALGLPKGVTGKGAGGGRRRSLLGGYKAHSEAVAESYRHNLDTNRGGDSHGPSSDGPLVAPDGQSQNAKNNGRTPGRARKTRRLSETPRESARMPGAELAVSQRRGGPRDGGNRGIGGGGGGLAKCQRVWKMVPKAKDNRPTWLRQYEDGSISYGSHYQNAPGRRKKEVHFRVRLSWARLERIVTDRPNTRRFADFRPKQRYAFFRKLGLDDLLAIAYRETVASSGTATGVAKAPLAELDLKSWHKFVVSLGFLADVSQPARHHEIEQMYRQRTRQYKAELKKLEALAAKERERQLAEERAHARRLAAMGEATGGADDPAQQQGRPKSVAGTRPGTGSASAAALKTPGASRPNTGARTASRGRSAEKSANGGARQRGGGTADGGSAPSRKPPGLRYTTGCGSCAGITPERTAGSQRGPPSEAPARQYVAHGSGAGVGPGQSQPSANAASATGVTAGNAGAQVESVRSHQQVVMKHVLDQDLRMDLTGFKDALDALVLLREPELEQKGSRMEGLRDLVFNHLLVRPELEGVREMAWLQAKTWIRMVVKRSQYLAELRRLEALRIAALRKAASMSIQAWFHRLSWLSTFAVVCEKRRLEAIRRLREWRAMKRRKRRRREEAVVFRQSRDLNGCMVMVSMSKKGQRGLDMHVRAYVPRTQETFRFVITEKALHDQLCRALKMESLSGAEILENLDLVAARLSCRKQRDGRRWVVSRAKRVAAESGSLVFRVASRLDKTFYFFKVYRSATDVAVTAYEPKRCETLRAVLPLRGARGISVWIRWEVEMATIRRKRELSRRLGEVQKILKLHRMNVEIERPKLLAARRLNDAVLQRKSPLSKAEGSHKKNDKTLERASSAATRVKPPPQAARLLTATSVGQGGEDSTPGNMPFSAGTIIASSAAAPKEAPPVDAQLTGLGELPFVWYQGAVPDLEFFGDGMPLETDEVASAPEIDITARGREVTLARWILRRVMVERIRVVDAVLPGSGGGSSRGRGEDGPGEKQAPRPVARWERVLVTLYEVETRRRNLAASRVQGLSRMLRARDRARSRILSQFEKRFDVYSGTFYYHSNKTGVDTFVKPGLLRPDQDLEEPADEWIEQKDRSGKTFYTNPATGQRSALSVSEAAAIIVKGCRYHLQAFYGVPGLDAIERGLRFSSEAEEAWRLGGGRLASTLNYALVLHTHHQDLDSAGPLYDTALKLSGENPLVQRACGLFLLSSCRFPREKSRKKGLELLSAADYRDRDLNTFALAEGAFFHFGLLTAPTRARALMNWALVLEHVRRDAAQAELFYRRAVAANDLDPLVLANYKSFCLERLPGGSFPGGGPGSRVLRRSRIDSKSPDCDGWKRYRDPEASEACLATFWFHPTHQVISWQGPSEETAREKS